jgi:integrase
MPDYRLGRLKGQFVVVWEEGSRRRRYRLGTVDPATARAALREFIRGRERLEAPEAGQLTIGQIWQDYLADREAAGIASADRMRDAWKAMGARFGELAPMDLMDGSEARAYVLARRGAGVGDGTIHTELGYLRAALHLAKRRGTITVIPDISLPPKPRPRTKHLTAEQAKMLLAGAITPHVRLFMLLALYTAGRPSAILDLTWDRVDFDRRVIHLDNPARDKTPKGRATVPMAEALVAPLADAKRGALSAYVIEWAGGRVLSVKKGVALAAKRAGLEGVSPYILRHTAAVLLAEAGVPLIEIASYLGHTNPSVTFRVYARFSPDYLRKASDALDTVLQNPANRERGE